MKKPRQMVPCRFYMSGPEKCKNGDGCTFSHDPEIIQQAIVDGSAPPPTACKYFMTKGQCRNGEACAFSHDATVIAQAMQDTLEGKPAPGAGPDFGFDACVPVPAGSLPAYPSACASHGRHWRAAVIVWFARPVRPH